MADQQYFYGTGRRKNAVARVRLYPGNGAVVINGKPMEEVFSRDIHRAEVVSPLRRLGRDDWLVGHRLGQLISAAAYYCRGH